MGELRVPELDRVAEAAAELLGVPLTMISTFDDAGQHVRGASGLPTSTEAIHGGAYNPLCKRVQTTQKPVIVHDARGRRAEGDDVLVELGVTAYAGFPVMHDDVTIGVLAAIDRRIHHWHDRDVTALRAFAACTSVLLAQRATNEIVADRTERRAAEFEALSLHDELTGLLNRRGFLAVADGQLALAHRQGCSGFVLFLDVDGLKVTNDEIGHAAGDDLLRAAAEVLRTTFRDADTIGRLGGDEFVVFSVSDPRNFASVAKRLADAVIVSNRERSSEARLQWSLGVIPFDATLGPTLSFLVAEADRRMYDAKQRSRRQVT